MQIEGPTIETQRVLVRTRPGATMRVPAHKDAYQPELVTIYGDDLEHVAGPTRPIEGVVRDLDSGRPLAGIMVRGEHRLEFGSGEFVHAVTDAQGRYRLVGLPQGQEGHVLAVAPGDFPYYGRRKARLQVPPDESLPYLRARVPVGKSDGPGPVHLDINLKRGVWVTGRLIDRETQKPVRGQVEYFVFVDNPRYQEYPAFRSARIGPYFVGGDGAFHFAAFPGPGMIAARADESRYVRAVGVEKMKGRKDKDRVPPDFSVHRDARQLQRPRPDRPGPRDRVVEPRPLAGVGTVAGRDGAGAGRQALDRSVRHRLEGDDLVGESPARDVGIPHLEPEAGAEPDPGLPRRCEAAGRRAGAPRRRDPAANGDPPALGRLDRPRRQCRGPARGGEEHPSPSPTCTATDPQIDREGRFRIEGLVPGKSYDLSLMTRQRIQIGSLARGVKLGPGEIRDLGDVTPRQPEK